MRRVCVAAAVTFAAAAGSLAHEPCVGGFRPMQDGVEFTEPRSPYIPYKHGVTDHLRGVERRLRETGAGPLFLQDHGSPTRYRHVWIRRLDDDELR